MKFRFVVALLVAFFVASPSARAQNFVHPGGLHTRADLDRMKIKVAAGQRPWIDGWNVLIQDRKAQSHYQAAPHPHMGSRQRAQDDATAAYLNALRWSISGDKSNADCAVRILNGWAATVKETPRGPDQPGLSGIPIGNFALAAEVLRPYPGWSAADQSRFKELLVKFFYPICHDFLTRHNGASDTNYWANWDTCNMLAIAAIGIFCDDRAKFDEAVDYFKNGRGTGAIRNAVPFRYPGGLGQWQESGRDQAHVMGGMGLLAEMCQVAWNQGVDLFGYDNNRLLAGAEYTAQYTLWRGVPYTFYTNSAKANQYYISQNYHGRLDASHFELLYNHYVVRRGLKAPNVRLFAELKRPESGEIDVFGYGTLTFTLDARASPYPVVVVPPVPRNLTATPGVGRVELKWAPSGASTTKGYEVLRATARSGPYTSISKTDRWTTPFHTDPQVTNGMTYFYKVAALNDAGISPPSAPINATPIAAGPLPAGWDSLDIGKSGRASGDGFAPAAGNTFAIVATGSDVGGSKDNCRFVHRSVSGDFTITARLIDRRGPVPKFGLMARENPNPDARMLAVTLGEVGGRQARFGTRTLPGGPMTTQPGNDYTWIPVWFRLQRQGDVFTAFQSSDGVTWFPIGTSTVPIKKECLAGLVATSGDKEDQPPAGATFDNVTIAPAPPVPPAAPGSLTAASSSEGVNLSWKVASSGQTGFKIEASGGDGLFYEIADLGPEATSFIHTGLKSPAALRYRVRAYTTGGYSAYSNVAGAAAPLPDRR